MFDWYKNIEYYYKKGYWTIEQVRMAVVKEKITEEQFKEITGEDYIQKTTKPRPEPNNSDQEDRTEQDEQTSEQPVLKKK